MKIERDIDRIKKLSKEKEEENWSFRSFLKTSEIPSKKIDIIVQQLSQKISSRIDCQTCGNCCREILPALKENDIINMAGNLNLSVKKFKKNYLKKAEAPDAYTFNTNPCPFLEGNICSVFDARPEDCRSYPHLHKKNFVSRTIGVINNCSICPVVFNVYENLKNEIWAMGDFDEEY
jgi:Fe-S-cluster containining protein